MTRRDLAAALHHLEHLAALATDPHRLALERLAYSAPSSTSKRGGPRTLRELGARARTDETVSSPVVIHLLRHGSEATCDRCAVVSVRLVAGDENGAVRRKGRRR